MTHNGPLNDAEIHRLGLADLRQALSEQASHDGREVNFMIRAPNEGGDLLSKPAIDLPPPGTPRRVFAEESNE